MNNLGLLAFYQCALTKNMTEAALKLGVTQSALSQRIQALESDLEATLFIREAKTLSLTPTGLELLNYCNSYKSLEEEFLLKVKGSHELAGPIRIGAYSSILRSVLLPKLSPFLRQHPKVNADLKSYETDELYDVLRSAKADMVVTDTTLNKKGVNEVIIGHEDYVVIESGKFSTPSDVYIDHDSADKTTEEYFSKQLHGPKSFKRIFLGDVYGVIEGVEQGLGRAVMSKHLIESNKKVKVVAGFKKVQRPIILCYYDRPFYPELFKKILSLLEI
jgi:DNA-binding transcriptional LysR family regulator